MAAAAAETAGTSGGGGGKEDKLAAFAAYDFDACADFQQHLTSIELPAGSSAAAAALLKVKAKFYRRCVDEEFDPAWVAAASAPPPAQQQQQQQQPQPAPRPSSTTTTSASASAGRAAGGTAPPPPRPLAGSPLLAVPPPQAALPLLAGFALTVVHVASSLLAPGLAGPAYRNAVLAYTLAFLALTLRDVGAPALSLAALKAWLPRASASRSGQYFMLALAGAMGGASGGGQPVTALLVPLAVTAAYGLAAYAHARYGRTGAWAARGGAAAYAWLGGRQHQAQLLCAQGEVMLGVVLLVGCVISRRFLLTFQVWQLLRLRYWSADGAVLHRQVWQQLDQQTAGLRAMLPISQRVVGWFVAFFEAGRPHAA